MKNKKIIFTSLMCLSLSLGIGGALILNSNSTEKVEASSYSTSTVTKNLNLNDASESTIRNYYSDLNSLSASERQGTNLLKNLKPILKNNQKYFSYGGSATTAVWQIYEIVDRDWEKSPASSIPGYNANTNTVTNYTYGTSISSNVGSNPYIHALYVNRDVDNQTRAWDNHSQDDWGINQEHVWAKSCGFDDKSSATGARGDVMHLWAGNGRVNGQFHSNYYYGFVDKTKSYTDAGKDKMNYTNLTGNLTGFSKTFGGSNTVFEPQDSDKGDIARAIFYMAARYNYYSGSDSDGIDAGNPNLVLVNNVSSWSNSGYTSSTSTQGKMGILQDLLEWNRIDPPDEWEIHRNNLCYNNFTNNRNPFIDFPEWAEYIWGSSNNGNYNSTVTGYASPQNDLINNFAGQVTGSVSISDINKRITAGGTATISATSSDGSTISWTSSNTNVATVSSATSASGANITINAIAAGNATITARATIDDKVYSKTCEVAVVSPASGDEITSSITVASYASANGWQDSKKYTSLLIDSNVTASVNNGGGNTGKYYNTGKDWRFYQSETAKIEFSAAEGYVIDKLTVNYTVADSGALYDMSDNPIVSGTEYNINSSDVIYQIGGSGSTGKVKFTSFSVTYHQVQQVTLSSITLDTSNVQTVFTTGDAFNHSGLVVTAHYSDASTEIVSPSSVSEPDFQEESGTITITVNYLGKTATYDITLITSISASVNKTYKVGDVISTSDITVVDNEDNEIDNFVFAEDGYVFTYEDANSGGSATEKVFEVSFGNLTTDLTVSVSRETPTVFNDTLNYSLIGVSGTTYKDWDNKQSNSNAIYSGRSAGGNTAIQLRSSGSVEGIVQTTSGGIVASVEVTWNSNTTSGRKINIYGKNTAYSAASDLFDNNAGTLIGSITYNSTTKLTIDDSYAFIGIRSNSGALYLDEIVINYRADAKALSNFLMYEDTNNQCLTKLDDAIDMFDKLSSSDRESFMTSDEYVIETARERFEAWLVHEEKEISYSAGDYTIVDSRALLFDVIRQDSQLPTYILITIASISMASIVGYLYLRKKKEN